MSAPIKWEYMLFWLLSMSARLSVRLYVCLSRFRDRSISFEPMVGFTNVK